MTSWLRCALFLFVAMPALRAAPEPALTPPSAARPQIHVALDGRAIQVRVDDRQNRVDLDAYVNAAQLREGKILFCRRIRGTMYLVMDLGGPSKVPEDATHCGAGQENNLVWIKLDRNLKPIEIQSTLYESCWLTITSEKGCKIHGDELNLRFTDFQSGHAIQNWLHYNNRAADAGFIVLKMN